MAARKPPARSHSRAVTLAQVSERVTALETELKIALEHLPEKIGLEIIKAITGLASAETVRELAAEVATLKERNSYAAGAVKVEGRFRDQAQEWARALTPVLWPAAIVFAAARFGG